MQIWKYRSIYFNDLNISTCILNSNKHKCLYDVNPFADFEKKCQKCIMSLMAVWCFSLIQDGWEVKEQSIGAGLTSLFTISTLRRDMIMLALVDTCSTVIEQYRERFNWTKIWCMEIVETVHKWQGCPRKWVWLYQDMMTASCMCPLHQVTPLQHWMVYNRAWPLSVQSCMLMNKLNWTQIKLNSSLQGGSKMVEQISVSFPSIFWCQN